MFVLKCTSSITGTAYIVLVSRWYSSWLCENVITCLCCNCIILNCLVHSVFQATQQSHTILSTWFRSNKTNVIVSRNFQEIINCVVCWVYRNNMILCSISLVLMVEIVHCQYFYVARWVTLPIRLTVSLDWLKVSWRLSLSWNLWLTGNSSLPILVETHRRPLSSYFASQLYNLPSLVEDVRTTLADFFCLSEFIASLCLVETIRRSLPSYVAWKNYSLPNRLIVG